jgi:hypothetical protein
VRHWTTDDGVKPEDVPESCRTVVAGQERQKNKWTLGALMWRASYTFWTWWYSREGKWHFSRKGEGALLKRNGAANGSAHPRNCPTLKQSIPIPRASENGLESRSFRRKHTLYAGLRTRNLLYRSKNTSSLPD